MKTAAVIVAAGRGTRASDAAAGPKQYADLGGRAMLAHSMASFINHPLVDLVAVVINPLDEDRYRQISLPFGSKLRGAVAGGSSRQESVLRGLEALAGEDFDAVLIHDAARPFVSAEIIDGVIDGLATHQGAVAALALVDTLKWSKDDGAIGATVPRNNLWRAQTPQGFHYQAILEAHRQAAAADRSDFTDDASIAEWAGLTVRLTEGSARNDKVTTAEDLQIARRFIAENVIVEARTGSGFDVHRFTEGDAVLLCGVNIPHNKRLEGHSDADVGLHALTDAILGAIADGDIGQHFPPLDPQWRGVASHVFLSDAARRVGKLGGRIANVDVTIICEVPKVGPHRDAMRRSISDILQLELSRVCVKATTTERLGFTGRGEGIAAMASATVLLPAPR